MKNLIKTHFFRLLPVKKTLKIMKLSIILFSLAFLNIYATGFNQEAKVTMRHNNVSAKTVFKDIENATGYRFVYNDETVSWLSDVSVNAKNKEIGEILNDLLLNSDIEYRVLEDKLIVLTKSTASITQEVTVTGRVTDAVTGEPLPGVSIVIRGTAIGTTTDVNGQYSISDVPPDASLEFAFIGMQTRVIPVEGRTAIDVALAVEAIGLEEVVSIGYATQRRATLTGSIATSRGEELQRAPAISLSNTFSGRMPGLIALNRTGEPGKDFSELLIRGRGTLGNNEPLIVIDGVAAREGLNTIDPRDVENISVLKDASAAIYGARAANGVILITTKQGRTGDPTISYSANQGIMNHTTWPEMSDSYLLAKFHNYQDTEIYGRSPRWSEEDLQKFKDGSSPDTHPNTNYIEELLRPWVPTSKHNLSVNGGTENIRYFISGNYTDQSGQFIDAAHRYDVIGGRANFEVDVRKNLTMGVNLSFSEQNEKRGTNETRHQIYQIYMGSPHSQVFHPDGHLTYDVVYGTDIPGYDKTKKSYYQTTFTLNYKFPFLEGLGLSGLFSYDKNDSDNKVLSRGFYYWWYDVRNTNWSRWWGGPAKPSLSNRKDYWTSMQGNIKLTYDYETDNHRINTFVAAEAGEDYTNYLSAFRRDFPTDAIEQIFAGSEVAMRTDGLESKFGRRNYFGRVSYGYQNKYLLDFTLRYDGSTIFHKDYRWGLFPGFSAGWILSNETFFQADFVDMLKIRGSYGQMGNDAIDPFQYMAMYTFTRGAFFGSDQALQQGLLQSVEANPRVTWEVATNTNFGFDLYLWEGLLDMEFDYFKGRRENILTQRYASVPVYSGLTLPDENLGIVDNWGFELNLSHKKRTTGDFNYNIYGNVSLAKNKIVFIDEAPDLPEHQKQEGFPIGSGLFYEFTGIYRSQAEIDATPHPPGTRVNDMQFRDVDGDGSITAADRIRLSKTSTPEVVFGAGTSMMYRSFDLHIFLQGQTRAWKYANFPYGRGNVPRYYAKNVPYADNPDSKFPNIYDDESEIGAWASTFWVNDVSFLRIKNVEIGYHLPSDFTRKIGLSDVRVYVNGVNLGFLWDKWGLGFDPEGEGGWTQRQQFYPMNRIINFGINVTI
jgi:TonB-linked SusC/RagA family outer membrane protein